MEKKTKTMQKARMLRATSLIAIMLFSIQSSPLSAQVTLNSRASELTITGRTHTQFNTTSVAGEKSSEFLLRRTRLTAEVTVNDLVSGKVQQTLVVGRSL